MAINRSFLDELEEVSSPASLISPAAPIQAPKKTGSINMAFLESLEADEHPEVQDNKARAVQPDTLYPGPASAKTLSQAELALAPPAPSDQGLFRPNGTFVGGMDMPDSLYKETYLEPSERDPIQAIINAYGTGELDVGKKYKGKVGEETYARFKYALTYGLSLGGRLGPKTLKQELEEEAKGFTGIGDIVMPAVTDTGVLAFEWGYMYPELIKAA